MLLEILRAGENVLEELQLCQRYFCKSYDLDTDLGSNTLEGIITARPDNNALMSNHAPRVDWPVVMRTEPSVETYDQLGNSGTVSGHSSGATTTPNNDNISRTGQDPSTKSYRYIVIAAGMAVVFFHYAADAEL